ncbi:MAG TPA: hypothetical protein VIM61_02285 [Chthoniobacterales bacterium]
MKALGIEIVSGDLKWVILDGDKNGGVFEFLTDNSLALPQADTDDCGNLLALTQSARNHFQTLGVERVGIIRADKGCSVLRAKVEFALQIACRESGVPCSLISILTVRAAVDRKVMQITGNSLWDIYNGGLEIRPKYLTKPAHAAWCVHNAV